MLSIPKVLCAPVLLLALGAPPAAAEDGPRATVETLVEAVRSFKGDSNGALTPADWQRNAEAAKLANSSLAIREVCRTSLGRQLGHAG